MAAAAAPGASPRPQHGINVLDHVERCKTEVDMAQEAAEIARASAQALIRVQRRSAEIAQLAYGAQGPPGAGVGDVGGGEGKPPHEHPLVPCGDPEDWVCDGCGRQSTDFLMTRFTCAERCDFDLCEACRADSLRAAARAAANDEPAACAPPQANEINKDTRVVKTSVEATASGGCSTPSCLSAEDRKRFGLEDACPPPAPAEGGAAEAPGARPWTSLSAEDRRRFGLDGPAAPGGAPTPPDGGAGPAPEGPWRPGPAHALTPMAHTLAKLEAAGVPHSLDKLEESERLLQFLNMQAQRRG